MPATGKSAVLYRLLEPPGLRLTPAVARNLVGLRADVATQVRVNELARLVSQALPQVETYFRHADGGCRIDFAIGLESVISLQRCR